MNKMRLDVALVERGLCESRQKAQAAIMAGLVTVNAQKVMKAGTGIIETDIIEVKGPAIPYVSRGGLKLEKAIKLWEIDLNGKICADIGASTGGFSDCMLQFGAAKVYAVDTGYGKLDWKIRTDPRVIALERTNARYLTREQVPDPLDLASVDVSFISLRLILPALRNVIKDGGEVVCLIKPQFEAGRENVGKKGVVRDPAIHLQVLEHFLGYAKENTFSVKALTFSPIKGPEGNIEYLGHIVASEMPSQEFYLKKLVTESHEALEGV